MYWKMKKPEELNCDDWIRASSEASVWSKEGRPEADWCKREIIKTIFPEGSSCHKTGIFEDLRNKSEVLIWLPQLPDLSPAETLVERAGRKGAAAHTLVPDTTADLQASFGGEVKSSMSHSYFCQHRPTRFLGSGSR